MSTSPAEPLLTAALIVRDEEDCLPACLESVRALVDEIVVVDTGSVDSTVEIARAHGASVHHVVWTDDFAAARNAALELAHGRWILWIDADERLAPIERSDLDPFLARDEISAYMALLRPAPGFTPYLECRLFRNDAAIRFEGAVHERIFPSASAHGGVARCPLLIEHIGGSKPLRDLPLLVRHADDVDRTRRLAVASAELGDLEAARRAFETALELVRAESSTAPAAALTYSGYAQLLLDCGDDADAAISEGIDRFPDHHLLVWMRARVAEDEEAIEWYSRLLDVDVDRLPESGISYDERLFDAIPHAGIAASLFGLGRYEESAIAYARAAESAPDDLEIRAKGALAAARAREACVAA